MGSKIVWKRIVNTANLQPKFLVDYLNSADEFAAMFLELFRSIFNNYQGTS